MKLEIYQDKRGKWRWRVVAKNNEVVAEGGQGYKSRKPMMKNLPRFLREALITAEEAYKSEYPNG